MTTKPRIGATYFEPLRRDSGPAIAAAAAVARRRDPEAVVLALAADHIILDVPEFRATCLAGRAAAEAGRIVTFGIRPNEPKTSYGYVLPGDALGTEGVHAVARFVEKPDATVAARGPSSRSHTLWALTSRNPSRA